MHLLGEATLQDAEARADDGEEDDEWKGARLRGACIQEGITSVSSSEAMDLFRLIIRLQLAAASRELVSKVVG